MTALNRRSLLKASALLGTAGAAGLLAGRFGLPATAFAAAAPVEMKARAIEVDITGKGATRGMMTYGEGPVPPVLRARQGEAFAARLVNALEEPTTIHWHGVRVPVGMDGVPLLSQPYVYPGDGFDYAFTPPDAGTFWYHPHCNTLEQMGRGLAGMLIVEGKDDPVFDAEIPLMLRDWRLGGDGQFIAPFKARDAAKAGTYGTLRTANWQKEPQIDAPAGGLVRLRLLAADVTRIYTMQLEGAQATVIAIDGNPVPRRFALDTLMVGPGQRLDLALRMPDAEGAIARLMDIRGSQPKPIASFRATGPSLRRAPGDLGPLTANPVPAFDASAAASLDMKLSATAETAPKTSICGTLGYTFWAINNVAWSGDTDPTAPLAELKQGRSYRIRLANPTPHAHPIHLHGMNFVVLSSSARPVQSFVTDTWLMLPDEQVELGLVADNPGDWVFHCHIIEHQKSGMTTYLRVV
ncbi:multicopper oxidase family protein [Gellertiella hungarica]|uniref:FtsP/CotA-like multicopper oxidase with cupredoxin domain n=1 Tax=Gellertiella hungarica TaxID=1572859 RepID=A0A7W6NLN3_9HYPH|nr:multicopper oxidase family protein [Gellertiella hungarica]MBB4065512.1 FtsP/CotA-like multicopper oxidase with cupredoxin domain [Gellertiella hungarica]